MKKIKALVALSIVALFLTSCFEDRDDNLIQPKSIKDFVWKAMNYGYLYKSESPNLADDRFNNDSDYNAFLNGFPSPEALFESFLFQPSVVDRFSRIHPDYFVLEQRLQGIFKTNGMEYSLYPAPNSNTNLIGVVRLVLPNSDADNKGVKRGDLFAQINNTQITRENRFALFSQDVYTINLSDYNNNGTTDNTDDTITQNGTNISLEKTRYTEDPIFAASTINLNGETVAYLMYNGFTFGSEVELNTIFANFKAQNAKHLVLDLRYNPGGSVTTTTFLASMITGQFTGQVFEKLVYNENLQDRNVDYNFTDNIGETTLNSLELEKVYIIATRASASASEGLINGLKPYIDVVHIGENTVGKTQASRVFYDSGRDNEFRRQGANPAHTYALQPLVADGVNKNLESVPGTGLTPTSGFEYEERPLNLGDIGNMNEPMLGIALADIENASGKKRTIKQKPAIFSATDMHSNDFLPFEKGGMIAD